MLCLKSRSGVGKTCHSDPLLTGEIEGMKAVGLPQVGKKVRLINGDNGQFRPI
jgi:hypothetical protein